MDAKLKDYISKKQALITNEVERLIDLNDIPKNIINSMLYSMEAGGKRLRPILLFASYEAFNKEIAPSLSTALALEMIHTYSLIHDDLPAMDDDDYRRGQLTNHKVFNEATAILAGDGLLTLSFEIICNDSLLSDNQKVKVVQMLSEASGPKGMVAGQVLDLEAENTSVSLNELEKIHKLKTGKLVSFAITTGAYLGGASNEQITELETFAYYLGLIFQVQDDILDITGDQEKIGKATGSDESNEKSTYPKLLGLEGAINKKSEYVMAAKKALKQAEADSEILIGLIDYFSQRDH